MMEETPEENEFNRYFRLESIHLITFDISDWK